MRAVVIGCGRVGANVAHALVAADWDVTVVDESEDALTRLGELDVRGARIPRARVAGDEAPCRECVDQARHAAQAEPHRLGERRLDQP